MLEVLGIGSVTLLLIFAGVYLLIRRYSRAKKREGAAEVREAAKDHVIEQVKDANRAVEAARRGIDGDWIDGVRRRFQRD